MGRRVRLAGCFSISGAVMARSGSSFAAEVARRKGLAKVVKYLFGYLDGHTAASKLIHDGRGNVMASFYA